MVGVRGWAGGGVGWWVGTGRLNCDEIENDQIFSVLLPPPATNPLGTGGTDGIADKH